MGSIFEGLEVEAYDRSYSDVELLRRIQRYFSTQKRRLLVIGLTVLVIVAGDLAQPIIISQGVGVLAKSTS
ncbi:MAG TPA: hypothetical protein VMT34_13510, partial [Aggregatilineales bacterium]|nr:hypothetical protein [Aggregatilineales bacterium]